MTLSIKSQILSRNFTHGREAPPGIDLIVIHVTEGDAASVVSWFNDDDANVSAHYLVRADGKIIQFVDEHDTAWHAGRVQAPTARLVVQRPEINPNNYSIGIEHEGDGKHELTDAQRAASVALIADICQRHHIPMDRDHIVGHHEIFSGKTCPGAISVSRLVAMARELGGASPREPTPPKPIIVWSNFLHDWLLVTRYLSDDVWYYRTMSELSLIKGQVASTPLSQMPLAPPPRPTP